MLLKSFEIQLYRSGDWKINSVFDDSELACFEARRMFDSGLYSGVRVVEDEYNDSTGATKTRTIFNTSKVDRHNAQAVKDRSAVIKDAMAGRKKRTAARVQKKKNKKKSFGVARILLILLALAGAAIGAMIGLQFLQRML